MLNDDYSTLALLGLLLMIYPIIIAILMAVVS